MKIEYRKVKKIEKLKKKFNNYDKNDEGEKVFVKKSTT